ncbi:hypothetical protein NFJ07_02790 [Arthrobacter sp. B2a2-09]|nr:hypothetical protein [Arthrobacter sp. B2a2-09]MCZ9880712.1 hypothetical protein [Arthrobacter sp. B2a2-09]
MPAAPRWLTSNILPRRSVSVSAAIPARGKPAAGAVLAATVGEGHTPEAR